MRVVNAREAAAHGSKGKGEASKKDQVSVFRFLDLPGEVRLEFYGYYAYAHKVVLPEDDRVQTRRHAAKLEAKKKDIRGMKKTRKSLLSVSHQVSEEWAPIFYRTTTVLINPLNSRRVTQKSQVNTLRFTAGEFAKIFLSKANSRLRYVTKIKYVDYARSYNESPGAKVQIGLQSLISILQAHYLRLPSLQKVTLHTINERRPFIDGITDLDKGDLVKSFMAVGLGKWVTHCQRQLALAGSRNGIWSSMRKMEYGDSRKVSYVQYWDWKSLKVVCRRESEWH